MKSTLYSNFISKTVAFTKFLQKERDRGKNSTLSARIGFPPKFREINFFLLHYKSHCNLISRKNVTVIRSELVFYTVLNIKMINAYQSKQINHLA